MSAAIDEGSSDAHKDSLLMAAGVADEGDLGTDRDPVLTAEAAFEVNNPEARDSLALELFPDEPVKRAKFRLAWDLFQQRSEGKQ